MTSSFAHLRVHTEYSLVDGMVRIQPLVDAVRASQMPAVAVSDQSNVFALVKFYKAAMSAGIKPILASEVWIQPRDEGEDPSVAILLVQNEAGYRNLFELLSNGYLKGQKMGRAMLSMDWVRDQSDGLIALSGGKDGDIGRALLSKKRDLAGALLEEWMQIFPDRYYLELHRTGRNDEEEYLHMAVDLAQESSCPVVATNDVRFITADQFEAHEVRVCIQEGRTLDDPRRERRYSDQQYLKSPQEMVQLFSDVPEAIANSIEIAKRCSVSIEFGEYYLPNYPVPDGKSSAQYCRQVAEQGLESRLQSIFRGDDLADVRKPYDERLAYELTVIEQMGFTSYFLIVMEFIRWAKQMGIPVGPGRGSGTGSLVSYCLDITDVDPLRYDLLFERFLNPARVSMPDFDVDFCMAGRDRVIQHVAERYGREAVSQIITFGTMAAKAVVRDVARVQGKPYGLADKLSKLIPFDPGMTLQKALDEEVLLREFVDQSEDAQEIMEMAFQVEGLARNVGKHAGGVVIAPTKLTDFSPIFCDEGGGGLMTQFDKKDVEQSGLVKFDFLSLKTLTIIDWALNSINSRNGDQIDINQIPLDDAEVFELLRAARTTAVFQLESRGMKDLIKRLVPESFEDIIALVALFRPGPMLMADDFINRKNGKERIDCLHPDLEPVLRNTYGVMLYQEQVMQIAQVLAEFTMAQADLLRRAMGEKNQQEMSTQREQFLKGAVGRGVDENQANHIFDLMEKFAGYGFNKSHSVAYALIAYQTAWLKTHFAADFMAAVLSVDMQNTDKIVTNIEECRELGVKILPPDINQSGLRFVADGEDAIVYGLGAIKGLGEGPIDSIVSAREASGPFVDLYDLCSRVELHKVNKRVLDALVGSGALDLLIDAPQDLDANQVINWKRALLAANQEDKARLAAQKIRDRDSGNRDLFEESTLSNEASAYQHVQDLHIWSYRERLAKEKETLGLYLTGHPIDVYQQELGKLAKCKIVDLRVGSEEQAVAGFVMSLRTMKSKRGDTIAFVTLDDRSGRVEVSVTGAVFESNHEKLQKDRVLVVSGSVSNDDYSGGIRMRATNVQNLLEAREKSVKRMLVRLDSRNLDTDFQSRLAGILEPYRGNGGCPVVIAYSRDDACAEVLLGDEWRVQPHDDLIQQLKDHYGTERIDLDY
jgi:DNA polymerase-3 subunit alpha